MSIRAGLNHFTRYGYDRPVHLGPHFFRLRPAAHCRTPIEAYSMSIKPEPHFINWQQDPFGNYLARVVFPKKVRELSVEVDLLVDMTVINPFDFFLEDSAQYYPFDYGERLKKELLPYLEIAEDGPLLKERVGRIDRSRVRIIDFLVELNRQIQQEIAYTVRMQPGVQTCEETLSSAVGACRDSAWLLMQILRRLGLAARFVSGYLVQLAPDVKSLDGPSGPEKDFTDLHAWTEVYVPGAGWLGLDPTSGLFAGEGHIPLACTPEPASAAPVTGVVETCETDFFFRNTVRRISEDPRTTKPYSEEQWQAVMALGRKVDSELEAGDVRLSMGGEPTFVSIDDMQADEWNTTADGAHKRRLAADLVWRLFRIFAAGGLLHRGQGKWYPGEPLPRWQFNCFWRSDGKLLWKDPALLAVGAQGREADISDAEGFLRHLAGELGVDEGCVQAGYEDVFYHLWQEGRLPVDADPLKTDLRDPAQRRRLAQLLDRGLEQPAGFVLPLRRHPDGRGWQTSRWQFRRPQMFLIPGSSPMGLRLPLEALPLAEPAERFPDPERSPLDPRPPLPDFHLEPHVLHSAAAGPHRDLPTEPSRGAVVGGRELVRTALCVEPREQRLHVFMPPLRILEDYLALLAAVEKTAAALGRPVVIEGYEPPPDHRLKRIQVAPDPGVIEVNIHPAGSWEELVHNTRTLYEEARLARLGTEKFMVDGRHTGTGGGNHVTIGGATPVDSPILRRPSLLRSLITCWQHHPGLSYLFSGLFVGPTSQAPRVDEARDEQINELEIAFQHMPGGDVAQPWLADRLLRNLLVDLTGNTHRTEFSIDKLYPPEVLGRRLGLVELRAFDMPPHYRMSLVQLLLVRTLIARFWNNPYHHRLVRWGTELHDRFMLPHYVRADLTDLLVELQRDGYPFQLEWLEPFFEFRFPRYGAVTIGDIEIELRMAVEPWPVLGEEVVRSGTARFVDSSLERLQVKVRGLTDSRYLLTCNGRRVPLHNTGTRGEYVAGVRYRAWQPPSALHPTIGVHSPLVFDLIDTWNGRSIGGCTYHVAHPGGRSYDTFPVNAYEAEARRVSRFWNYGHTPGWFQPPPDTSALGRFSPEGNPPGPMAPPPEEINAEYPHTLDLRRQPERPR
jgi:uncharacterized protein (DUF2126 family)/transglutaminase-like putative cysteine protease